MHVHRRILASGLAFALCLPVPAAWAQRPQPQAESPPPAQPQAAPANIALPKGVSAGPSIESISEYTLANGLRVLLFPDASKPTVTVNVTYGVGSAQENYGETGMAHLLEHLVFKGTPRHPDISGEMKKRGIGFNATTSLDRTNYFASFPADDATLDWLLGMEADRMVNSNIAQKDLDSEMTVVRNEMESGENNPGGVLFQRIRSTAFLWHNYGNTTIGARSDVEGVPIDRLEAFYRTWYQPDNATLIIAGRIDPAWTLARVAAHFGQLRKPARTLPRFYTAEPPQDGEREVTVRRVGDLRLVAAAYHVPAAAHPDTAALDVLANLLGHTPGGRLHKALVETRLAAGTGASGESLCDPGLLSVVAVVPKDGDAGKAEAELIAQVERLAQRPVTPQEVDEAKRRIGNAHDLYFTDVNAVGRGLSEFIAAGDWRLLFLTRDAVEKVTAEDVNRVAAQYLKPSNRTLGRFVPTDTPDRVQVPAAPDVASLVKGYTGRAAVSAGENFDPSPQNLQARTETFTLGDSLKVSLLPKKTRGGTVVLQATFRFGDVASLSVAPDSAGGLAGAMLMRGSRRLTREQIDQRFEALRTQASVGGGLQSAQISLQSRRAQLPEALALAAQILRTPSFPESEFEQLRVQAITGLEASRREPGSVAGQAMALHFDPWPEGHPLHAKTLDESLASVRALKIEDLRAFHRDFYGTAEGEIAVVGDFDPARIKQQLQALFAGWKSPRPYVTIHTRYTRQAERGAAGPQQPGAEGHRPGVPGDDGGQPRVRRRRAEVAPGRPHPAEGRAELRRVQRRARRRQPRRHRRRRQPRPAGDRRTGQHGAGGNGDPRGTAAAGGRRPHRRRAGRRQVRRADAARTGPRERRHRRRHARRPALLRPHHGVHRRTGCALRGADPGRGQRGDLQAHPPGRPEPVRCRRFRVGRERERRQRGLAGRQCRARGDARAPARGRRLRHRWTMAADPPITFLRMATLLRRGLYREAVAASSRALCLRVDHRAQTVSNGLGSSAATILSGSADGRGSRRPPNPSYNL